MAPASYREPGLRLIANSPCFLRPSASSFPEPTHGVRTPSTAPSPCGHYAPGSSSVLAVHMALSSRQGRGLQLCPARWQSRPVVAHL